MYHLDCLNWLSDRTMVTHEVFMEKLNTILSKSKWIIDGNYASAMEYRLNKCDTVIWLDYDEITCLQGIIERVGIERSDISWIESEVDPQLVEFVKDYSTVSRLRVLELQVSHPTKNELSSKTGKRVSIIYNKYKK